MRPRGLAYLDGVLKQPNAGRKLSAFVRFREYVARRTGRHSRATATDRAIANELAVGDVHSVVSRRSCLDLTAATWATIYRLGVVTDTSPKTILEALVSLGLEQASMSIREQGIAPQVAA